MSNAALQGFVLWQATMACFKHYSNNCKCTLSPYHVLRFYRAPTY